MKYIVFLFLITLFKAQDLTEESIVDEGLVNDLNEKVNNAV